MDGAFLVVFCEYLCYICFNWFSRETSPPDGPRMQTDVESLARLVEQLPEYGKVTLDASGVVWRRSYKVPRQQLRKVLALRQEGEHLEVERYPEGYRITMIRIQRTTQV